MHYRSVDEVPGQALFNEHRVTVGMVLVTETRRGIILVQSTKGSAMQWILPQGGVEPGESFRQAFLREATTELPGIQIESAMPFLGDHINELPPERGKLDKHIFWFAALVSTLPRGVNTEELTSFCIVHRPDELDAAICAARPEKRTMILNMVEETRKTGMLLWPQRVREAA